MKFKILFIVLLVVLGIGYVVFTVVTKSNNNDTNNTVTPGDNLQSGNPDLPIEPAALVVRKDLAMRLGVEEKKIVILEVAEKMWNNGCLGLEQRGEMCTEALVSGFRVLLAVDGKQYAYRTNKDGTVFRAEPGVVKTGEVINN
ncbi:MAG: hypothetical protein G01um101413_696 [Parcubacteria group bacterium Gr01-1014_13]|nr:MAG: hypothetical protein G01um101413_696 [Parcubacteria group bacterium Gr01-1014_13]